MTYAIADFRKPPHVDALTMLFGKPEHTDWLDESMSWKEHCYIGDWSFLPQTRFSGPEVLDLFASISANSFAKVPVGVSKHLIHVNRDGKLMHEGILTRLDDDDYVYHGQGGHWASYVLEHGDFKAQARDDDWFIFQLSGPTALPTLLKLTGDDTVLDVKYMRSTQVRISGITLRALRQGMAGEIGFELQGPREHGKKIWDAILEAGQEYGIRQLGARVTPINHLENAIPTSGLDYVPGVFGDEYAQYVNEQLAPRQHGHPFPSIAGSFHGESLSDYYRDPVEFGWGRNIKFDHAFHGDAALQRIAEAPQRVLRTLVWNSDDVLDIHASLFRPGPNYTFMDMPRDQRGYVWADRVERNGSEVGVSTSWGYSYYFRQVMSLCVLNVADAEPGTEVDVVWGSDGAPEKHVKATVAAAPYKTDRSRGDLRAIVA
jgi:glycine cleavage system aminomethyltransferase T